MTETEHWDCCSGHGGPCGLCVRVALALALRRQQLGVVLRDPPAACNQQALSRQSAANHQGRQQLGVVLGGPPLRSRDATEMQGRCVRDA